MDFNVNQYIRMLEEEGIYEPKTSDSTAQARDTPATNSVRDSYKNKDDFLYRLKKDPVTTLDKLKDLPVDLQSLELINSLLFSGSLDDYDPTSFVQDYIQHALRCIEHLGPDAENSQDASALASGSGRRDDQLRAIKLLILFIRNLLTRNVLSLQTSYFELQEICVRFIWVKEVRDLKNDLESGVW